MPARKLRVGAAQFASAVGDVDANLAIHLEWISRGRAADLDLLVLPEVSLTGHYGPERLLQAAMRAHDPRLLALAEAAGDMAVVAGFIEEAPGALFHNAAAILRRGQVAHLHRKINIPTYGLLEEGKHYGGGSRVTTWDLDGDWRAALMICADVWNPALAHLAFLQGATLLVVPVSSGIEAVAPEFDNPGGWAVAMRFYSLVYGAPSIMANRTGVERDLTFWGGSRILDARGRELAVAGAEPALITAELDYADVRLARRNLPTIRDSDPLLVQSELERVLRGQVGAQHNPGPAPTDPGLR